MMSALSLLGGAALLLIALAAAAGWARSYWAADSLWWNGTNRIHAAVLTKGKVELVFQQVNASAPFSIRADRGHMWGQPPVDIQFDNYEFLGFGYTSGADAYGSAQKVLVPYWLLTAGSAALWVLWLRRRRTARAATLRRQNRCIR